MAHDSPHLYCTELRTGQWEAMLAWYRQRLGLRATVRVVEDRYALLDAGGTRLALIGRDAPGDASRRWSLAFEVADLAAALARVAGEGERILPQRHAEGYCEAVVTDPDGNRVRLFAWDAGGSDR